MALEQTHSLVEVALKVRQHDLTLVNAGQQPAEIEVLLLMKGPPTFFEVRPVESAPELGGSVDYIILDGQQRLTGLYQAIYNRGPLVYAIKLDVLQSTDVDTLEEALVTIKRDVWERSTPNPPLQLNASLLPVSALRTAADFFAWRDEAVRLIDGGSDINTRITRLYRDVLAGLHDYDIPSIIVDSSIEPAAIARIFERVNRTGMRLSTFDLMVARSYSPGFNLRTRWEDARQELPRLQAFFGDDGLPVLSVIALRHRNDLRQQAVLDLTGSEVRDSWERAAIQLDHALRFMVERLGVWGPDWAPYRNLLTVTAGLSYDMDLNSQAGRIAAWFWDTVFGQRYDVASNTRAVADFRRLQRLTGDERPALVLVRQVFLEATKKQSGALHRGVACAIASGEPRDPVTGALLSSAGLENGRLPDVEVVSLFPRRSGLAVGVDPPIHLRSLGMVLCHSESARVVSDERLLGSETTALRSQWIDPTSIGKGWGAFLETRLEALAEFLRERTGMAVVIADDEAA